MRNMLCGVLYLCITSKKRLQRLINILKVKKYISALELHWMNPKIRKIKWNEFEIRLYDILNRVSCCYCQNNNMKELRNYQKYLTQYFDRLCDLEKGIGKPMKKTKYLKERFERNDE